MKLPQTTDTQRAAVAHQRLVRLCVDCRFHAAGRCLRQPDLVTGEAQEGWRGQCAKQREEWWPLSVLANTCGTSGRFFQPNAQAQATTPAPTNDDHGNKQ